MHSFIPTTTSTTTSSFAPHYHWASLVTSALLSAALYVLLYPVIAALRQFAKHHSNSLKARLTEVVLVVVVFAGLYGILLTALYILVLLILSRPRLTGLVVVEQL